MPNCVPVYIDYLADAIVPCKYGDRPPLPSSSLIYAEHLTVGTGAVIESQIGTPERPVQWLNLGDNVYIGPGCNIQVPELAIADYTKIHRNCLIFGHNRLYIGYNSWIGEGTIIDCEGHVRIEDGVGIGAHSQLWSHIRHGDTLEGCRYLKYGTLTIEDDVWFVGSCIVSPIHAKKKSMALVGSVVTRDMEQNHVYGGSPARDLTDKLGEPFATRTLEEKNKDFAERLEFFYSTNPEYPRTIKQYAFGQLESLGHTVFNVADRVYTKKGTPEEVAFMKFLLPEAKFTPTGRYLWTI